MDYRPHARLLVGVMYLQWMFSYLFAFQVDSSREPIWWVIATAAVALVAHVGMFLAWVKQITGKDRAAMVLFIVGFGSALPCLAGKIQTINPNDLMLLLIIGGAFVYGSIYTALIKNFGGYITEKSDRP